MLKVIYYVNHKGGINNLQVAKVYSRTPFNGLGNILAVFTSTKMLAEKRADNYIKKHNKE